MPNNLSNTLKTIENKLRRDANMSGQIDYNEQIAWMLFLKALDLLDKQQEQEARLAGRIYDPILHPPFTWSSWIKEDRTAEEKMEFIKTGLFPHLRSQSGHPQRQLIAQVFTDIPTKLPKSPFTLAEVLDLIGDINLNSSEDTHIVSQFYEESLLKMGSQGRQAGGEFYTPRPIIRLILKILNPKIDETILDPFMGSAGFLAEAFLYLKNKESLTAKEYEKLQFNTFIGQELKPIPFLLGVMNCILHGLYGAKFLHKNTFSDNIRNLNPQDRIDVVITNPPFGGEVEPLLLENFPFPTSSTQVLALQYILRRLKLGGRCGLVVDDGLLFRTDKAFLNTKKELLEENNLYAIISLPQGVFTSVGTNNKTSLVFFEKGKKTQEIWYYELSGKFTKSKPVRDAQLEDCLNKFLNREASNNSWFVDVNNLKSYDLSAENPYIKGEITQISSDRLLQIIQQRETGIQKLLIEVQKEL